MPDYVITWEIDLTAENPVAAARQALAIQRNPDSHATVFSVYPEQGEPITIDLLDDDSLQRAIDA